MTPAEGPRILGGAINFSTALTLKAGRGSGPTIKCALQLGQMVVIMGGDARRPVFEADATMGRVKRPAVPLLEVSFRSSARTSERRLRKASNAAPASCRRYWRSSAQRSASNGTGISPPIPHSAKFTGAPTTRTRVKPQCDQLLDVAEMADHLLGCPVLGVRAARELCVTLAMNRGSDFIRATGHALEALLERLLQPLITCWHRDPSGRSLLYTAENDQASRDRPTALVRLLE